ncbi:MAG: carboxypeptidase-like regulatory domain-containing protein, partial [Bacteroidetes bacterium]|nr:carboxypeptidase-like regulatory domain-containing protein [Bacteroidota bacterium]
MMSKQLLVCLLFICPFLGELAAQTTIKGQILDSTTKETLIGAAVVIEGTSIGVTTDIDGKFSLQTDRSLPLNLQISFLGYSTRIINVTSANASNIKVNLESDAVLMTAVEVKAQRTYFATAFARLTVERMDALA